MALMTPSEYKARFENLVIPLQRGGTETVKIQKYRNRGLAGYYNGPAFARFQSRWIDEKKNTVKLQLRIDTVAGSSAQAAAPPASADGAAAASATAGELVPASFLEHLPYNYCFGGKGSPEACQVVLQLVDRWGLAPSGLQDYADDAMGLDCNGLVGNYLWHVVNGLPWKADGHPWTELGYGSHDVGPDAGISAYLPDSKLVDNWSSLKPNKTYVMGLVGSNGRVIDRGGDAHVVLVEPRAYRAASPAKPQGIWAVECTAGHQDIGLWESWYSLDPNPPKKTTFRKVFDILREDMLAARQHFPFSIAEI